MRIPTNQPPVHPGEILLEEFMKPYDITSTELSRRINLSIKYINAVISGEQGISTEMALRLSLLFGTSPELWLNGQIKLDIWQVLHGENAGYLKIIEPVKIPAPIESHIKEYNINGKVSYSQG